MWFRVEPQRAQRRQENIKCKNKRCGFVHYKPKTSLICLLHYSRQLCYIANKYFFHKPQMNLLYLICFFLVSCATTQQLAKSDSSPDILIQNINVVDLEQQIILPSQDITITGKRITSISDHNSSRENTGLIIDGSGKYLIPGLWDMHSHPLSERDLLLMILNGVTGTRIMDGDTNTLRWKKNITNGHYLGPVIYTSGETFEGSPPEELKHLVLSLEGWELVNNRTDAITAVKRHKQMGYDFIKIYNNLKDSVTEAIFAEAKRQDMDVCGHIPIETGLQKSIALGIKSVEHLRGYINEILADTALVKPGLDFRSRTLAWNYIDPQKAERIIDLTVAEKVWNCPTFTFELILSPDSEINAYLSTPEASYLLENQIKYYTDRRSIPWASNFSDDDFINSVPSLKNRFDFVGLLHKKGGLILAGSDADVYGASLHRELENLASCGLNNYEVLKTATLNPSIYFGIEKDFGTVSINKIADLVILDANPIENINNTRSVFSVIREGRVLNRDIINIMKAELQTKEGKSRYKTRR